MNFVETDFYMSSHSIQREISAWHLILPVNIGVKKARFFPWQSHFLANFIVQLPDLRSRLFW